MIRTLMATSALALLLSTSAYAQDNTVAPATNNQVAPAQQEVRQPVDEVSFLGSQLMGEQVYNGTADTAENIGDVKDVVIGQNGEIQFVVVGVGGFLGIGEHHVAVAPADVTMTRDGANSVALTMNATKEQMKARPEFKYVSSWRTDEVKSTSSIGSGSVTDEATARARAEGMGYTNVAALSKNAAGVWMGSAKKDGRDVTVMIDATGRVSTK